ncbi:hypothetical protein WR25_17714 isoform I [Diploscapter pachys]|uniref:RING-type E3 ubiquitin transferase n=1 Tax=Diploscapter pachys TaxID=2018661 RepID=A0A2A2JNE3_9BILA|nr:hypothetical protein WR25_17714 isoform I [Diploscapter pachys]
MSTEDPEEKELPLNTAEGAEITLTEYDKIREPHPLLPPSTSVRITPKMLSDLTCPICLDLLSQTMATKECLHRFCSECITMALLRGNKECPTCRKKLVSKRSLRPDPNFDLLINSIFPDRSVFEKMQSSLWVTAASTESSTGSNSNDDSGESIESESPDEEITRKRSRDEDSDDSDDDNDMKRLKIDENDEDEEPQQLSTGENGDRPTLGTFLHESPSKLEQIGPRSEQNESKETSSKYPDCDMDDPDDIVANDGVTAEELLSLDEYEEIESDSDESEESNNDDDENSQKSEKGEVKKKRNVKSIEEGEVVSDESGSEENGKVEVERKDGKNAEEDDDSSDGWYTDHGTDDEDVDSTERNSEWLEDIELATKMELEKRLAKHHKKEGASEETQKQTAGGSNGNAEKNAGNGEVKIEPNEDNESDTGYDEYVADHDLIEYSFGSIHPEQALEDIIKAPSLYDAYVPIVYSSSRIIPTEGDFDEAEELDDGVNGVITTGNENGNEYGDGDEENGGNSGDEEPEEPEHDAYEFVDETEEQRVNEARHNENGHSSGEMSSNPNGQLSAQRDNDNDSENCDLDFYTEEELHEEIEELNEAVAEIGEDAVLDLKEEENDEDSYTTSTFSSSGNTSLENISDLSSEIELPLDGKANETEIAAGESSNTDTQTSQVATTSTATTSTNQFIMNHQMLNRGITSPLFRYPFDTTRLSSGNATGTPSTSLTPAASSSSTQNSFISELGIAQNLSHASLLGQRLGLAMASSPNETTERISLKDVPTGSCKERLQKWLADYPSSPLAPEENMEENLERSVEDEDALYAAMSDVDEIEIELLPAACLTARDIPEEMLTPRYIRAKHDTTMEHLSEYIHLRVMEEVQSNQFDFDADPVPTIQRPEHFYVFVSHSMNLFQ